ncbi:acyl carrier protein [Micromonospora sp. NBC_01699]|uniref:acyl carrier protein n=1 Tax=Micromonospora sp. NBC_01699 TaxID=2975984 RepID=UPI002E2E42D1|nr:acyl carrier protein [Micromonospora sp. NBC_01699]
MTAVVEPARLRDLVADVLELSPGTVTDEDSPATRSEWTSLRHLQLIVTLEEVYQVSFAYEEVRDVPSVGFLRDVLRRKGAAA